MHHLGHDSYVGRVGFLLRGWPMILPVNYLLDDESIIFRTTAGTVLSTREGAAVAFEVDAVRPMEHAGWSVVVRGMAHQITDADELERLRHGPLQSWAWHSAGIWFRISIDTVSGRRLPER